MKFFYLWHTAKYLKPSQIYYQLYYRLRSKLRSWRRFRYRHLTKQSNPRLLDLVEPISARTYYQSSNYFIFLNQGEQFEDTIDWNYAEFGKLWTYHLNYFDYLNQSDMSAQQGLRLMHAFVDDVESIKDGLEPYPISLRGMNWIKFLSRHQIQDQRLSDSLYAQYDILLDNLEYHILGNHLLENGFSLLFGGAFFQDDRLFDTGMKIVSAEVSEQILADGGHFERSPMYHCIILERMLDVLNLFQSMNNAACLSFSQSSLSSTSFPDSFTSSSSSSMSFPRSSPSFPHTSSSFPRSSLSFPRRRESSLNNNDKNGHKNSRSRTPSETTARSQSDHLKWSGEFRDDGRVEFNSQFLWYEQLHKMLTWLQVMQRPDGTLPHFNDTAQGVASEVKEIFDYARRLGLQFSGCWEANIRSERLDSRLRGNDEEVCGNDGLECGNDGEESRDNGEKSADDEIENDPINVNSKSLIHLPESGYIKLSHKQAELICDVGKIGPDYIPGHAHADTLSFEFYYAGQPIIVNTGTSCYGYSERRAFERSSPAHNCLVVDGQDSSEVWSGFRVARRAYPFNLQVDADNKQVTCAHDGYKRLNHPVVHTRSWQLKDDCLDITDQVKGKFDQAQLYYYLYPGLSYKQLTHNEYYIQQSGKNLLKLAFNSSVRSAKIADYLYVSEFMNCVDAQVLIIDSSASTITTQIIWL